MIIINRQMESGSSVSERSRTSTNCQASFNSDGVITLRNYTDWKLESDEIIILSAAETKAIQELFSKIGLMARNYTLPLMELMMQKKILSFPTNQVPLGTSIEIVKYRLDDDSILIPTKVLAIENVENTETHNGVTEDELIHALRRLFDHYEF